MSKPAVQSESAAILRTVTRPAFRSEPGGRVAVTVTAIQDAPSQNIAAVVSFQNAAGQPGSPNAAKTAAAVPGCFVAGGREAAGEVGLGPTRTGAGTRIRA